MKTITILTCDRQPSYLADTVATIPEEYAIQYISQGAILPPRSGVVVEVDKRYQSDPTRHRDSQFNYANALLHTVDGLIIEDDVKLCKNFNWELEQRLAEIPTKRYVIALYSCYNWNLYFKYNEIAEYPVDMFYGTQAMVFDTETAKEFGTYLLDNIGREPYDLALKTFIKTVNPEVGLYASKLSLVQHIGDVSTGLGHQHQTFNFIDDLI
jgi:hypothetical protein